jgi:hypothetical protein
MATVDKERGGTFTRTWADVIREAQAAVDAAVTRRNELLVTARNAGITTRSLGRLVGCSASTITRWAPLPGDDVRGDDMLDQPFPSRTHRGGRDG